MTRLFNLLMVVCLVFGISGSSVMASAQMEDALDLAAVPVPIQSLPESGYQVVAGGYISQQEVASLIAGPRNLDESSVSSWFEELHLTRAYTLDLALPEDRGWQDSPFLTVLQTNVYQTDGPETAADLHSRLEDFANTSFVEDRSPAVADAHTISFVGEAGDQIRTIVQREDVVIEIVSLDATGSPNETDHILVVEETLDRLDSQRDNGGTKLSLMALSLQPGDTTADFAHAQQTGVHGIYRYRDIGVQPALGELGTEEMEMPAGLNSTYLSSGMSRAGGGIGIVSIWLGDFADENSASGYFDELVSGAPEAVLADPYYTPDIDERWSEQGILGVYRVSGELNGQPYSGNIEIRQEGEVLIVIGYRSVGATLPSANITSGLMDHQLSCITSQSVCPPFELVIEEQAPQASPVVDGAGFQSNEFGWSLPHLGPDWVVTEQFSEPGYDRYALINGPSIIELESVINHHGEPQQCVLDELHLLEEFESHAVITVWEDVSGNTEGGNTGNHAWIVYRVEPLAEERADQEYVIRLDCYTLIDGSANLVVRHITPVDLWEQERPKGDELRDAILLP